VEEERTEEAQEVFLKLQEAYEKNDLDEVRRISEQVEDGLAFGSRSERITDVERLEAEVERLRHRVDDLEQELDALRFSEAYQTLMDLDDLDAYFEGRKKELKDELDRLRDEESTSNDA